LNKLLLETGILKGVSGEDLEMENMLLDTGGVIILVTEWQKVWLNFLLLLGRK
jgi:hypothetical protein